VTIWTAAVHQRTRTTSRAALPTQSTGCAIGQKATPRLAPAYATRGTVRRRYRVAGRVSALGQRLRPPLSRYTVASADQEVALGRCCPRGGVATPPGAGVRSHLAGSGKDASDQADGMPRLHPRQLRRTLPVSFTIVRTWIEGQQELSHLHQCGW
jgi:hypothetical protein